MIKSIKLENVPQSFARINPDGKFAQYKHLPYYADIITAHVQGFTKTCIDGKEYSLFTNGSSHTKDGLLIRKPDLDSKQYKKVKMPSGLNHPGGMQAIAQYVFVPCEYKPESSLFVFDVSQEDLPVVKSLHFGHAASSCGITDFEYMGKTRYVIAVNANPTCYLYISEDTETTDITKMDFIEIGQFDLTKFSGKDDDFEGVGLVTDVNNNIFLITLFSRKEYATLADFAMLLGINVKTIEGQDIFQIKVDYYETKHLISHGAVGGEDGVHFRWGNGIYISEKQGLCIAGTARNILSLGSTKLDTNTWPERDKENYS